jgi:hypothetical protein
MTMTEKTSFGITFSPPSFTLYNPSPYYQDVSVTVPVGGLGAGTYAANIYVSVTGQGPKDTPNVAGTDGFFQFVKTVCPPPQATISGVKFNDKNANGIRDVGEEGLPDWTIQLWKDGTCVQTTTTGSAGDYIFTVTAAGTYRVMEVLQTGWRQTAPPALGYYEFFVSLGDTITGKDFGNKKQYYLTVTDNIGGLSDVSTQSGWYDECTYVDLTAPEYVDVDVTDGMRYKFDHWDVAVPVHMDADHTATAYYVKQYYLTVQIDPSVLTPAPTPASDWYDEWTPVIETAYDVSGYIFVYWDVDTTAVPGNPITVTMNAPHTATAHYWPCLEYEQFVTDSSFNVIDHFDTVMVPKDSSKTLFKLASTNPGQFYLNIKITNTWAVNTGPITVGYALDDDFILHPIQGDPIQVWTGPGITGTRIPATVTYGTSGTVTISDIAPGQAVYITIHMQYKWARGYYDRTTMSTWKADHEPNTFTCGYTVTLPSPPLPFPFDYTSTPCLTSLPDPVVVLGLED